MKMRAMEGTISNLLVPCWCLVGSGEQTRGGGLLSHGASSQAGWKRPTSTHRHLRSLRFTKKKCMGCFQHKALLFL